jgi:hypothetical protein
MPHANDPSKMVTIHWAIGIWLVCAISFVAFERLVARGDLWDTADALWFRVALYVMVICISPALVIYLIVVGVGCWLHSGLRSLIGKPLWLDGSDDGLLVRLIKRRQKYDERLSGEKISSWPGKHLWVEPEAVIFDITEKYVTAEIDGVDEAQIFQKIDASRETSRYRGKPTLTEYVTYRLCIEIPEYVELGHNLIQQQVDDCRKYVRHNIPKKEPYPPARLLREKLSVGEIEQLGAKIPAFLIVPHRAMEKLIFRKMAGDEVWSFRGRSTGGVALVRNGKPIAHVTTLHVTHGDVLPRIRPSHSI